MLPLLVPSLSPSSATIFEGSTKEPSIWEESCDPGRLWLRPYSDEEAFKTAWVIYLCGHQKLLMAPPLFSDCRLDGQDAKIFADQQLANMTGLNVDWTAEESSPPNSIARRSARAVLEGAFLLSMQVQYTTASSGGGVVVCFSRNAVYSDIECFNSGEVWAIVSDRNGFSKTWQLNGNGASVRDALREITSLLTRHA